ncbi:MAG TPA: HlyD family efflux transporter periplasmic adaptor subunit [Micropepsaceae bacterium]|jgi:HlyD family secretion protein|nr:HlyD family efflux transporter periplasmic adaptor subunit [Micropepsaceae bacterium]
MPLRRILGWFALIAAVAGVVVWSFWPQPVPVDVAAVTRGAFQVSVQDEGRTRVRDAYVVSAPVAGRLLRIGNRAGETVVAGKSIVAQLQPNEPAFLDARARAQAEALVKAAEAARKSADAAVKGAQADVDHAEPELKRVQSLAARGLIAKMELEDAERQERRAAAALTAARETLNVKQFELENARMLLADFREGTPRSMISIKAPVSGKVFRVLQQSEAALAAGTPILEIGDPQDLEIVVELLSTDAVKVAPGAAATITDWGGPKDLAASVRLVESSGFTKISALGVEEQRVRVILDVTEPRETWKQLGDGFRVNARIVVWQTPDTIHIPLSSLFRSGEKWQTFALRNGRAMRVDVMIGQINDLDAQILRGLQAGDQVILHPSDKITDGVPVTIRPN